MKKLIFNFTFIEGNLFLIFSLFILHESSGMRNFGDSFMSPGLFPALFGFMMFLLAFKLMRRGYKEVVKEEENKPDIASAGKQKLKDFLRVLIVTVLSVVYIWLLLPSVGFIPATIIFLSIFMIFLGERRIIYLLPISLFSPVLLYIVFRILLGIRLP